jgi:deazaflavin-dependent oxidoreductase (nitroreductase family)
MPTAKDFILRFGTTVHETLFKASNGRLLGRAGGMPVVALTTTGRKSGQPRTVMLTSPVQEGDKVVLVASNWGQSHHPGWLLNLRDNPEVTITMDGSTRRMRARVASPDEKNELWPRITDKYRGYAGYQEGTTRDIPVVILEPAS